MLENNKRIMTEYNIRNNDKIYAEICSESFNVGESIIAKKFVDAASMIT